MNGVIAPIVCTSICVLGLFLLGAMPADSNGQPQKISSVVNITETLLDMYPFIAVEFETNSTIVLRADEDGLLLINGTLAPFWEAIEKVAKHGFGLDEITTSGMGSQGNPTRFYAVMTK